MAKILQWTNKYSHEQGYVMSAKKADGYFVSTQNAAEAKVYSRQCDVARALNLLEAFGEFENNVFQAIEV